MKLVMSRAEFERAKRDHETDTRDDALEILWTGRRTDMPEASGYVALVSLNHWQMTIPIVIDESK